MSSTKTNGANRQRKFGELIRAENAACRIEDMIARAVREENLLRTHKQAAFMRRKNNAL